MPNKEHSAGGVIFEDGTVLLILAKNLKGDQVWTFPKGHLEPGETPETAAIREVSKTGWDCEIILPSTRPNTLSCAAGCWWTRKCTGSW